jgi:hypothetical protein
MQTERRKVAKLQKNVPSGLANNLSDLFTEIGKVSFGNFEQHLILRDKSGLSRIAIMDEQAKVKQNLEHCFSIIDRSIDYERAFTQKRIFRQAVAQSFQNNDEFDSDMSSESEDD